MDGKVDGKTPSTDDIDIEVLKQRKTRAKSAFTRAQNQLLMLLDEDDLPSRRLVRAASTKLGLAEETAMDALLVLSEEYQKRGDLQNVEKTGEEVEILANKLEDHQGKAREYLDSRRDEASSRSSEISDGMVKISSRTGKWQQEQERIRIEAEQHRSQVAAGMSSVKVQSLAPPVILHEQYGQIHTTGQQNIGDPVPGTYVPPLTPVNTVDMLRSSMNMPIYSQPSHNGIHNSFTCQPVPSNLLQNPYMSTGQVPAVVTTTSPRPNSYAIGQDLWKQLSRVSIPKFSGDKRNYPNWKSAFTACIDQAPATPEYKLLQLRQSLSGEALRVIENLGHSAVAYHAAKERLERKFGGRRRQIALYIEDLENFKPLRPGMSKDVDRFADLLDIAVINLREAGRNEELGNGSLYMQLQRKMTETMLAQYQRWVFEKSKVESVETLREWVIQEAEFQTMAAETIRGLQVNDVKRNPRYHVSQTLFVHPKHNSKGNQVRICKVCQNNEHMIWRCEVFKKMDVNQRWDTAKQFKLCFRCLQDGHRGSACSWKRMCGIDDCKETHNRLLHSNVRRDTIPESRKYSSTGNRDSRKGDFPSNQTARIQQAQGEDLPLEGEYINYQERSRTMTSSSNEENQGGYLALRTVPVILKNGNRRITVNALLDDGSTRTYLNSDVAAELGLQGEIQKVTVNVVNNRMETFETMPVETTLQSLDGNINMKITAFTTDRVTGNMRVVNWREHADKWKHLKGIKFPSCRSRPIVDMLIGIDYADLHFSLKDVKRESGGPAASLTPLGWTCIGNPNKNQNVSICSNFNRTFLTHEHPSNKDIMSILRKFWEIEAVTNHENSPYQKLEDKIAEEKVKKSLVFQNGLYQVSIPWKDGIPELPHNYETALRRLISTEKRLKKEKKIASEYSDIIASYEQKGYIRRVPDEDLQMHQGWYLPHFPVVRLDKSTTKVRIVFDASAKCDDVSLNDAIHQGPKLQRELFDVLLRFRRYPVALVCDIAEMYLRIEIAPHDRPYHRFLWRNLHSNEEPRVYEFTRVVFGVNCSPFHAQFVSHKHAEDNKEKYPRAAESILKSTYMDDTMDSVSDNQQGIKLYEDLSELWAAAGMHARKWLSNSTEVMKRIPEKDRAAEVDLVKGILPSMKTLGLLWLASEDVFTFKVILPEDHLKLTKRTLLSKVASIFDPMGFLSPFSIRGKMLLQETWVAGIDWDEVLPEDLDVKARQWFSELPRLTEIKVPRCLRSCLEDDVITEEIHMFVDASQEAYGAAGYIRYVYRSREVSCVLIASKTKVAPLISVSVPRLELMAAALGVKLAVSIAEVLGQDLHTVYFWSDSMNVLWWIKGQSRNFKPFVANRIGEIQRLTDPRQWRYVPTKKNPADALTRGMSSSTLSQLTEWWNGPEYLKHNESEWPENVIEKRKSMDEEKKRAHSTATTKPGTCANKDFTMMGNEEDLHPWRLNPGRFSCWTRLKRVYAWVNRFANNSRLNQDDRSTGELTSEEIEDASVRIIKESQSLSFPEEYDALSCGKTLPKNSKLLLLNPKMDAEGLMRCDSRIKNADYLSYDVRFPVILARNAEVTRLIVKHYHEVGNHVMGTNHTLSALSAHFWIIRGREEIRSWESNCWECRRRKAKTATQIMAPLPEVRMKKPLHAFARTAVDYAGPFITVQGRGKRRQKRYLCLFTCLTTRAVHLEMAYALDTDSFLNAFFRMVNRRGLPTEMVSDNGGNFVAGNRELRELVDQLDKEKVVKMTSNNGIKWHFNPPVSPHFGGVFETMIKAAKRATNAILGDASITDEELCTAFTGAEALINSRPLTYQSASPLDDVPLTPNHFLHGQVGGQFAPQSVDETQFSPRRRWRRVQELVRHFWHRWLQEWLPGLGSRKRWSQQQRDIQVGDVVLVVAPDTTRGHWPLGRVLETFPGQDGHIRVVKVQVGQSVLTRSISKLCPLGLAIDKSDE